MTTYNEIGLVERIRWPPWVHRVKDNYCHCHQPKVLFRRGMRVGMQEPDCLWWAHTHSAQVQDWESTLAAQSLELVQLVRATQNWCASTVLASNLMCMVRDTPRPSRDSICLSVFPPGTQSQRSKLQSFSRLLVNPMQSRGLENILKWRNGDWSQCWSQLLSRN